MSLDLLSDLLGIVAFLVIGGRALYLLERANGHYPSIMYALSITVILGIGFMSAPWVDARPFTVTLRFAALGATGIYIYRVGRWVTNHHHRGDSLQDSTRKE